jgi:NAD(P)-dependent dehydrogenase (short-subunit alcohol dehydrogenase family)
MGDAVLAAKPILDRFRLDGRTALVTGGGQGIGRGYAHALGEAGAAVAVVDIDLNLAEEVAGELTKKGIDTLAIKADVTRPDEIAWAVKTVLGKWGKLTIGVNNAGRGQWVDSEAMSGEDWDKMFDLNLRAVFLCAQAEGKVMLAAGYGKIINTASMSGSIVNVPQNQLAYNTSKAGVIHLTRSLASEWATRGVRVNSISPGYTRTKLLENLLASPEGKEMASAWTQMTPMKRMAEVTDLQGAVVFLAAQASDFMTGSDLIIDGGYCCW